MKFNFLRKSQTGFTLIEMLVTVTIVGILTGVGIPIYNGYQVEAKNNVTYKNGVTVSGLISTALYTNGYATAKDIESIKIKGQEIKDCFNKIEFDPTEIDLSINKWCIIITDIKTGDCTKKIGTNNEFCVDSKNTIHRGSAVKCSSQECTGGINTQEK